MSPTPDWLVPWLRWKLTGGRRPIGIPRRIPRRWQRVREPFVVWGRWYLGSRRDPRPEVALASPIPTWARTLLRDPDVKRVLGQPSAPPATKRPYLVSHRGALLNTPSGAGWNFAEAQAAGFEWVAANVGDFDPAAWEDVRVRAGNAGVHCVPWARLGHPHLGDTKGDCLSKLDSLIATAKAWGTTRPIVNVETEIKPVHLGGLVTPEEVAVRLDAAGMDEAAISTEGWLYDMHWVALTRFSVLLQILPRDTGWRAEDVRSKQAAAERRAEAYGFEHVGSSVQTYPMADGSHPDPGWFDLEGHNRSLIWGDNAQVAPGGWARWAG